MLTYIWPRYINSLYTQLKYWPSSPQGETDPNFVGELMAKSQLLFFAQGFGEVASIIFHPSKLLSFVCDLHLKG